MTWRDHYKLCTRVNWAMSLSGSGNPMLKTCLLWHEVQTPSSDWGSEAQLSRLLADCSRGSWNGREHVGFLPLLMQSDVIPGNYKQQNMASAVRRVCFFAFEVAIFIFANAMCISTYIFKVLPNAFGSLWTLIQNKSTAFPICQQNCNTWNLFFFFMSPQPSHFISVSNVEHWKRGQPLPPDGAPSVINRY